MTDVQKLTESRARLWEQMKAILDTATAEDRTTTAEERQTYNRLEGDLDAAGEQISQAERHQARAAEMNRVDRTGVVPAPVALNRDGDTADDYRMAFNMWARFGNGELTAEQTAILRAGAINTSDLRELRNAQGVGTGAGGGFTVPPLFRDALIEALKFYSSVRQESTLILTDTGASLPWMTNNDTANVGSILAENTAIAEADLVFGTATLDVFMYTSNLVRVSLQLLQDSAIDIEDFLPRKLGERIGRIQNAHFTTGTGTAQPLGFVTGGTAVVAPVGNTVGYSFDALVDATARLDPAYLGGGNLAWQGSQALLASFRKLKDTQGRPLWEPSYQVGAPDTLLGYRYIMNNDMPAPAVSAKSLAFGDFRTGYVVRDVTGLQTLRLGERYAEFLQVGWFAFMRSGGTVQDARAFTILQNSAT